MLLLQDLLHELSNRFLLRCGATTVLLVDIHAGGFVDNVESGGGGVARFVEFCPREDLWIFFAGAGSCGHLNSICKLVFTNRPD